MNIHSLHIEKRIQKYLTGKLSSEERHQFELDAIDDPFLFEALEGYKLYSEKDKTPKTRIIWIGGIAATVILLIAAVFLLQPKNGLNQLPQIVMNDALPSVQERDKPEQTFASDSSVDMFVREEDKSQFKTINKEAVNSKFISAESSQRDEAVVNVQEDIVRDLNHGNVQERAPGIIIERNNNERPGIAVDEVPMKVRTVNIIITDISQKLVLDQNLMSMLKEIYLDELDGNPEINGEIETIEASFLMTANNEVSGSHIEIINCNIELRRAMLEQVLNRFLRNTKSTNDLKLNSVYHVKIYSE